MLIAGPDAAAIVFAFARGRQLIVIYPRLLVKDGKITTPSQKPRLLCHHHHYNHHQQILLVLLFPDRDAFILSILSFHFQTFANFFFTKIEGWAEPAQITPNPLPRGTSQK